jgi:hypothetical protein
MSKLDTSAEPLIRDERRDGCRHLTLITSLAHLAVVDDRLVSNRCTLLRAELADAIL